MENTGTRINKYLADKGLATRKGADALVEAGKVFLNGKRAVLGQKVGVEDKVEVRGVSRRTSGHYIAYYKPAGYVTHSPVSGEKAIADTFETKGLFPVGRLDKNSEGLIILTDDGRITDRLLNPKYEHEKEYTVESAVPVGPSFAKKLESGVNIGEGTLTKPCTVKLLGPTHFSITLTEGKNHQIKRMTEALGVSVRALKRIRIGNITLGDLKPNGSRELKGRELEKFLTSLGLHS